jgi:hypothetical protein
VSATARGTAGAGRAALVLTQFEQQIHQVKIAEITSLAVERDPPTYVAGLAFAPVSLRVQNELIRA